MNQRRLSRTVTRAATFALVLGCWGVVATTVSARQGVTVPEGGKTIWSGVFSDAQAERGEKVYVEKCAYCHRADLSGAEIGPPLKGLPFLIRWEGKIANLFFKIGNTMPQDKPATMEPSEVADILGFMLKMNAIPSGKTELAPTESLETIFIVRDEPAAP